MAVKKEAFGATPDQKQISLYTITNANGLSASFSDLGAVWVRMMAPDRNGKPGDVLLGYDTGEAYLENGPHFGAVVGRNANRIGGAAFLLEGKRYVLGKNDGENNLHSGPDYFEKRLWEAETGKNEVTFSIDSPDGDQGYPGNAKLSITYRLCDDGKLELTYRASCDQPTPMNPTNHAYFNLSAKGGSLVLDHEVQIHASYFTPTGEDLIPTGEIRPVEGTPMDFREKKTIGRDLGADFEPLKVAGGYDHNWCLDHLPFDCALAATAKDPESGRCMDVYTDLPGLQFYTANFLQGEKGKAGAVYRERSAFCFETQYFPDSINKAQFANPVLEPGMTFESRTIYRFYVEE